VSEPNWNGGDVIAAEDHDRAVAAAFAAGRAAASPDPPDEEFTEAAWGLIANAYGGNWGDAPDAWRGAAERWRDEYIAGANAHPRPAASPDERLREAALRAVFATVGVLPITGSHGRGYAVGDLIHQKVIAEPEEWADAADAICELHRLAAADREAPDEPKETTT